MATGFSGRLLANLSKLKEKEEGCDIELISKNGTSFAAHRIVLAASSDHLRSLLFKHPNKRKFNFHNVDNVGLELAVDYVYGGELDLTPTNKTVIKRSLLPAFEALGLTDAIESCQESLKTKEVKAHIKEDPGDDQPKVKHQAKVKADDAKVKAVQTKSKVQRTPAKRKRPPPKDNEVQDGAGYVEDVPFVDDSADEDFVPPGKKRRSLRRTIKKEVDVETIVSKQRKRDNVQHIPLKNPKDEVLDETDEAGEAVPNVDGFIQISESGKHRCVKCDSEFPKIKIARHHVRYICGFTDKKYKCQICGKGFTVLRYVTDHERRTHKHFRSREGGAPADISENKLQCSLCYTLFECKESIGSHLRDVHQLDEATLCRVMEELGPEDVITHEASDDTTLEDTVGDGEEIGVAAGMSVRKRKQAVRAEMLDKNRPYGCALCPARFTLKRYLNDHHRRVHAVRVKPVKDKARSRVTTTAIATTECKTIGGSYKCPDCAELFETLASFEEHRGLDTVQQMFECPCESCPETFNCMTSWEQHQLWRHDASSKYQCVKCGLLFTRAIKSHVKKCKLEPGGFSCERCEVNFKTKILLNIHFCKNSAKPIVASMKRAGSHRYRCGKCGRGFGRITDLTKHNYWDKCRPQRLRAGGKVVVKRCKNMGCKRIFYHKKTFLKHKRMCDKAECVMCDICGRVLPVNRILLHKKTHKEFLCTFCGKSFKTTQAYNLHKGTGHFQCELCGDVSPCQGELRSHMVFHGGNKKYTCNCGLKFKNVSNMKKHQEKCEASAETSKLHQCLECGVEFKTLMSLKSHSFIHTNPSKYQCNLCQRCFGTAAAFYSHRRNVHKDITHECPTCKKNFLSVKKLNDHHDRVHKGITHKYACDKCGAKFGGEYKFGKHMREMHMESIFKCPHCNQGFGYKSHLKDHIERCTGRMKVVKCEICNKTMQKTTYREHIKMHVTPKRFVCSKCGRGFDHKWLIGNHACKDAGTYVCNICGQKQKTIHGYRIHMNQHVKSQRLEPQVIQASDGALTSATETRAIEAFMGPDGQIYLPEGTVLAEGEELILEGGQEDMQNMYIKSEYQEGEMQNEVELIQSVQDPSSGTELVLSGADGDQEYIVQVIDEEQPQAEALTVDSDLTEGATPIDAQDVRYVQLADGEQVIQISLDDNTTLMLPCDKT